MPTPLEILKQYYGYDQFRSFQQEIIQSVLDGKDTLAILPTGGGKSICFQIPALAMDGICIVVSPLIALMKDQVYQLKKRNISAAAIYSGMHYKSIDNTLENAAYGHTKLLYVSPERLKTELFIERIKNMKVSMIAVDEAHCISEWGHDFRPAYRNISEIRTLLPDAPLIALTASARPEVQKDIQENLNFREGAHHFQKSFARTNLSYAVIHDGNKLRRLVTILQKVKGTALVYLRNRRGTKDVADYLKHNALNASHYHAGLSSQEREKRQNDWISDKVRIMVCTNAFGMGIDKSDVRCVIHLDIPESIEAYYQEAGRAGRDGEKSYALLLINEEERKAFLKKVALSKPSLEFQKKVYTCLCNFARLAEGSGEGVSLPFSWQDFLMKYELKGLRTSVAVKALEDNELIQLSEAYRKPAQIYIKASQNSLYEQQVKNKRHDILIKMLSRSYEGIFDLYIDVDLLQLSRLLKWSKSEVLSELGKLQKLNFIEYKVSTDSPILTFLQARLPSSHIQLNLKEQEHRYAVKEKQAESMLEYESSTSTCRSRTILSYFGETESESCGICDVCEGRYSDSSELIGTRRDVKELLNRRELSESAIRDQFKNIPKEKILNALRWLQDHGHIIKKKDQRFIAVSH